MHAIPTKYKGVQFRSRLEARWAKFFDLVGWQWDYEPIDLDGYIPDFILIFEKFGQLLVEVKPAMTIDELDGYAEEYNDKIYEYGGWDKHALIVGSKLFDEWSVLGMLYGTDSPDLQDAIWCHATAGLIRCKGQSEGLRCGKYGFAVECRISKCPSCGAEDRSWDWVDQKEICGLWRLAGNEVQWRKPRMLD